MMSLISQSSSSDGQENIQCPNYVISVAADNDPIPDAYSSHSSVDQDLSSETTDYQETDKDNPIHATIRPRRRVRKPRYLQDFLVMQMIDRENRKKILCLVKI